MTTTRAAWAHLPNAAHIDRVLADLRARPEAWHAAWHAARDTARDAAMDAAMEAAWEAVWEAARDAAWESASSAAWTAAWDAADSLIAWDDCAYLLEYTPTQVRALLALEPGNHAATLLLPACIVLNGDIK